MNPGRAPGPGSRVEGPARQPQGALDTLGEVSVGRVQFGGIGGPCGLPRKASLLSTLSLPAPSGHWPPASFPLDALGQSALVQAAPACP